MPPDTVGVTDPVAVPLYSITAVPHPPPHPPPHPDAPLVQFVHGDHTAPATDTAIEVNTTLPPTVIINHPPPEPPAPPKPPLPPQLGLDPPDAPPAPLNWSNPNSVVLRDVESFAPATQPADDAAHKAPPDHGLVDA